MKSSVVKRSVVVAGHKTSVSLEDEFWKGLRAIADGRDTTLSNLVATIDAGRQHRQPVISPSPLCPWLLSRSAWYRDQISDRRDTARVQLVA